MDLPPPNLGQGNYEEKKSEYNIHWRCPWCNGFGGARGLMVIVVGNEHGDTSSNPGRDCLHFT